MQFVIFCGRTLIVVFEIPGESGKLFCGTCLQLVLVKDVKECRELGPRLRASFCLCYQHHANQGGTDCFICEDSPATLSD